MTRAVLDTNVIVSALISKLKDRAPRLILIAWWQKRFSLLTSPSILKEVEEVLRYPKIYQRYRLSKKKIARMLEPFFQDAEMIRPKKFPLIVKEDPADNRILACGLEGKADFVISGDKHLLNLKNYQGIAIVTPRRFVKILGEIGKGGS